MNPGLVYLLGRLTVGTLRQARKRLGTRGGKLTLLVVLLVFAPYLAVRFIAYGEFQMAHEPIRKFGPLVVLVFTLSTGLSWGAVFFRPAEIDFLFPAPVTRRELLLYNILVRLRVQLLSSLFVSIFTVQWSPTIYGGCTGIFFVLTCMQLFAQLSGLVFATFGEHRRLRRLAIPALAGLLYIVYWAVQSRLSALGAAPGIREVLEELVHLPVLSHASQATRPFVEVFAAENLADYGLWCAVSVLVLVGMGVLITLFDVAYSESAVATAQQMQKKLARMRRGGVYTAGPSKVRFQIPMFPYLGGVGPIAWRQLTEISRSLWAFLSLGVGVGVWALMSLYLLRGSEERAEVAPLALVSPVIFVTIIMSIQMSFDFRRDIDRMDQLKSLPVSPMAMVTGQMLPNTLLLFFWQLLGTGMMLALAGRLPDPLLLSLLAVLPLVNFVSVALDNAVFLWMPYRMAPKDPGQFQFMGRMMMAMFLKMLAFMLLLGLPALVGGAVGALLESPEAGLVAGAVPLVGVAVFLNWGVARLFQSYDVSREVPG